jgi:translation initiation factor IF-3
MMEAEKTILLIDEDGTSLGRVKFNAARDISTRKGLDLVEVNQGEQIAVFKIMDKSKWKYQQSKMLRKQSKSPSLKEIRFRIATAEHDTETKLKHIKEFLSKGHPVKVTLEMKGREKANPDLARKKLESILQCLDDVVCDQMKFNQSNFSVLINSSAGVKNVAAS